MTCDQWIIRSRKLIERPQSTMKYKTLVIKKCMTSACDSVAELAAPYLV